MAKTKISQKNQTESVARLEAIISATVDAVITIDENRIIEAFNPAAEKMFGYSPDEAIGQNVKMIMPEPYHSEHDQYVENYKETGIKKIIGQGREERGRHKDGRDFPVLVSIGEASTAGRRMFVGVIRDLTLQKEAEREVEIQQRRLIDELSTPVIELWDHLLMLPIIGSVDSQRANQITESLLQSILDKQATVAVLDVTGVPVIDTDVATHLLKTVRAAQMMGAEVIITGFSAEAAKTLTQLGIDLSSVKTSGALKQGVAQALSTMGYRVTKVTAE
ncbi:MAG: PAS domain S-box protein [Dehalococcoidia bacterium]